MHLSELLRKLPTLEIIKQERARRSLEKFTTYTYEDYQVNWHHSVLCEKLHEWAFGDLDRLMIFMPPRNGKSELVSRRLPAFILGHDPDAAIISASYSADLSSRMNRDTQRIIDSQSYHDLFPDTTLSRSDFTQYKGAFIRNSDMFEIAGHKGVYKSAGVGGAITGMGMKYGIIDDPFKNRAEANSQTKRDSVWDWYTSTFYTRLEKGGKILITLTRWHEDDLAGRLIEQAKHDPEADQWEVVEFPAIAEGDLHPLDPRSDGEALWPDKYPIEKLKQMKATVGSYDWNALFQQRPAPAEGALFRREWWRYYETLPYNVDEYVLSWDLTFKDNPDNDYVVGQCWARSGADFYLVDQERAKLSFTQTVQAVRAFANKHPQARTILVEEKANGAAVIDTLQREISGIIPVNPEGGKITRAQAVTPLIEAGNVWLPKHAPWVGDLVTESSAFPNAKHDDQVDALTQALNRMANNGPADFFTTSAW